MGKYVSEFLSMKCCGDVLNIAAPVKNAEKEITEAMAMRQILKEITLAEPNKYTVYDLCAGNGLVGLLAVFTLPVHCVVAIDKKKRKRHWDDARRFIYTEEDIDRLDPTKLHRNSIITSCHPCSLANRIVDIYLESPAQHLIMMPCCKGAVNYKGKVYIPPLIQKAGKYEVWTYALARRANARYIKDNECLSPCNNIIIGEK